MYKLLISLILMLVMGFGIYYYKTIAEEQERQKEVYLSSNKLLICKLEKAYDDKMATDSKIKKLEELAKKDMDFDWGADISNSMVIMELKK